MSLGVWGWIGIIVGTCTLILIILGAIGSLEQERCADAAMRAKIVTLLGLGIDSNTPLTGDEEVQVKTLKTAMNDVKIKQWGADVGSWESEMIAARLRGDAEDLENQAVSRRQEASMRWRLVEMLLGRTGVDKEDFGEAGKVFGAEMEEEQEDDDSEKIAKKGNAVVGEVEELDDDENKDEENEKLHDAEKEDLGKDEEEEEVVVVEPIEVVTTVKKERTASRILKTEQYFVLKDLDESDFEDANYGRFDV